MSFVIAYVTAIYRLFMVNSAILAKKKMSEDVSFCPIMITAFIISTSKFAQEVLIRKERKVWHKIRRRE